MFDTFYRRHSTALRTSQTVPMTHPGTAACIEALKGFAPATEQQRSLRAQWLTLLATTPGVTDRHGPTAHVTVSALPITTDGRQVLLCRHPRYRRWGPWGGHMDAEDADVTGALHRELTEEAGPLPWRVVALVDLAEHEATYLPGTTVRHLDLLFRVEVPAALPPRLLAEVALGGWFPVDRLPEPGVPALRSLVERSLHGPVVAD
jgi:ADP-ribose pyrophosphatase YjhB (NUDIX family)